MPFISYLLLGVGVVMLGGVAYLMIKDVGKRLIRLLEAAVVVLGSGKNPSREELEATAKILKQL